MTAARTPSSLTASGWSIWEPWAASPAIQINANTPGQRRRMAKSPSPVGVLLAGLGDSSPILASWSSSRLRKNALRKPWQAIQILDCPLLLTAKAALRKVIGRLRGKASGNWAMFRRRPRNGHCRTRPEFPDTGHSPTTTLQCFSRFRQTSSPYPPSSPNVKSARGSTPYRCSMRLYPVRDIHLTYRSRTDLRCPRTASRHCPAAGSCSPLTSSITSSSYSTRSVFQSASWILLSSSRNCLARSSALL